MAECVFCTIARRATPAVIVYEDSSVIAFMDKNPINPGHVLVVPKLHEENFQDLTEGIYLKVAMAAKNIAKAVNAAYSPKKVGFAVAGFDVRHAHMHVIPLHDYHDLTSKHYLQHDEYHRAGEGAHEKPTPEELEREAYRIKNCMPSDR